MQLHLWLGHKKALNQFHCQRTDKQREANPPNHCPFVRCPPATEVLKSYRQQQQPKQRQQLAEARRGQQMDGLTKRVACIAACWLRHGNEVWPREQKRGSHGKQAMGSGVAG